MVVESDLSCCLDYEEQEAEPQHIEDCLKILSSEAKELYLSCTVPVLETAPTPLQFYREFVSQNRPVVVRGATEHWPASQLWLDNRYFRDEHGSKLVTVAVTPNGLADSPVGDRFVMPEERKMKFDTFLNIIEQEEDEGKQFSTTEQEEADKRKEIFYIQKQNSNLTEEFPEFLQQVSELDWASKAFGKEPDAINFWLGDRRAVTSMHKDPYENIYCVVRGYKDITLHPPADVAWIPYKSFTPAAYKYTEGGCIIEDLAGPKVPWICVDPLRPDLDAYPEYANSTPIKVRVHAGEALYLPSLWFHHLTQSQGCVSVNFWYDMEFDVKYNYFNLVRNLRKVLDRKTAAS